MQDKFDFIDGDKAAFKNILRQLDKPYIHSLYHDSKEEAKERDDGRTTEGCYMKNIAMHQYKNLTYLDSIMSENNNTTTDIDEISIDEHLSREQKREMKQFWGTGFSLEDYVRLRDQYQTYVAKYGVSTMNMQMLLKQICLTELDIDNARLEGNPVDKLLMSYQKLYDSAGLNPKQETEASADDQKENYGNWIKKLENERPVPEPHPAWKDVDQIMKYIRVFFTGHLAKMLGIKSKDAKLSEDYDKGIGEFTASLQDGDAEEDQEYGDDFK
ncbi:hypothetical protein [Bacillus sp. Marseille-P3800]|uniref:hypothetical protein n=1 Tax=Bacillus sp. Marseille-P3800 TaxID=2014782 RepID=UPI0011452F45|nr:hypothetical protein [Bacillus sp. Marseille-P3800]